MKMIGVWKGEFMYFYLKGVVTQKTEQCIIMEVGGIGYQVYISKQLLSDICVSEEIKMIYTYMSVKEDGMTLYGFQTQAEQSIFLKLLSVSGVGAKSGLSMISELSAEDIVMAIASGDIKTLSQAQGIGKKTAERIVLELKDKCSVMDSMVGDGGISQQNTKKVGVLAESIEALVSLGYTQMEATKVVKMVGSEDKTIEQILKLALQQMNQW